MIWSEHSETMRVLELMKTHVVKTTPDSTLAEAVDLMDLYQAGTLPVVDPQGRLCGMISEGDVMRALRLQGLSMTDAEKLQQRIPLAAGAAMDRVGEHMSQPALSVSEEADIREAASLLLSQGLKRLPVTREDGQVVGVLTRLDVCEAIFEGNL
ncbi:MAG TPA: CBS domain-containing protein [Chthonomonadaceae bacterium]|nr:CBS domain-containing protein [Chthonomonadaceae bacterium]